MSIEKVLRVRSDSKCELCSGEEELAVYEITPQDSDKGNEKGNGNNNDIANACLLICSTCMTQIEKPEKVDVNHWRCLNDSMWSQVPAVQVVAWRMLTRLRAEGWPQELLETLYLDEETLAWAQASDDESADESTVKHVDSYGAVLNAGDTITLIKDLNVKGANFTAKRGTAVRGISLVADNSDHIEGRVNGQQIVILTKFVKRSN